jgi:hypothetical protein
MFFSETRTESRREFMLGCAQAGAALAVAGGAQGALAAVTTSSVASSASVSPDLLQALGSRIGLEVAAMVGDAGAPLTLAYLDAAGPSVDALRAGIEQGVAWHAGTAPVCVETQVSAASTIGVALISNPATGRAVRVEINATALSMIALIESVKTPASSQKHSVLTASADNLYRVSYLS